MSSSKPEKQYGIAANASPGYDPMGEGVIPPGNSSELVTEGSPAEGCRLSLNRLPSPHVSFSGQSDECAPAIYSSYLAGLITRMFCVLTLSGAVWSYYRLMVNINYED